MLDVLEAGYVVAFYIFMGYTKSDGYKDWKIYMNYFEED